VLAPFCEKGVGGPSLMCAALYARRGRVAVVRQRPGCSRSIISAPYSSLGDVTKRGAYSGKSGGGWGFGADRLAPRAPCAADGVSASHGAADPRFPGAVVDRLKVLLTSP